MKFIKAFMVVSVVLGLSIGVAERASGQPAAVKKEDLRYDGKPFEYWQKFEWQKELKVERRIEILRAMSGFGANGYGKEAADIILDIAEAPWFNKQSKSEGYYQLQKEAGVALLAIGKEASPSIISRLERECLKELVDILISNNYSLTLSPSTIKPLVKYLQGEKSGTSFVALRLLGNQSDMDPASKAALADVMSDEAEAKKICQALLIWVKGINDTTPVVRIFENLGPQAKTAIPMLLVKMEEGLQELKDEKTRPHPWIQSGEPFAYRTIVPCITMLASIGPPAESALPLLQQIADDCDGSCGAAARTAMEKIRGTDDLAKKTNR